MSRPRIKRDKVEFSLKYLFVKKKVEKKVEQILLNEYGTISGRSMCHEYWKIKQRVLLEDYGIRWRTPAEMNPGTMFD